MSKPDKRKLNESTDKAPNDIPFDTKRTWKIAKHSEAKSELRKDFNTIDNFAPRSVNVYDYAEARGFEIKNLQQALQEAASMKNSRVFQQLPRHMRRRAASYDIRRIPRRLREKAKAENVTAPNKSKSRKHKRRPKNLLDEYNRRSKKKCWLETHLWHAKRFKMIEIWGYKIAMNPCDKGYRVAYRATQNRAILQDKSYMEVIEVKANVKEMDVLLKRVAVPFSATIDAAFTEGHCHQNLIAYHADSFPRGCIGPITLVPVPKLESNQQFFFIVLHPLISLEFAEMISLILNVNLVTNNGDKSTTQSSTAQSSVNHVILHKLDFAMFSLTGPLSGNILQEVLGVGDWGTNECAIHNLLVNDPRLTVPPTKQDPVNPLHSAATKPLVEFQTTSDLWNEVIREQVKQNKPSCEDINKLKSELLVPGPLDTAVTKVPVVVLKNKGKQSFDIILPGGWAMPFWIALVYQGARVGAIKEDQMIAFESSTPYFPHHFCDTKAGQEDSERIRKEKEAKHWRFPPKVRHNYDILGVSHPFALPWNDLVSQWIYNIPALFPNKNVAIPKKGFYIMRDKSTLAKLKNSLRDDSATLDLEVMLREHAQSLVCVKVIACHKGVPVDNSLICIPSVEDLKRFSNRSDVFLDSQFDGPEEPQHRGLIKNFPNVCKQQNILRHNARLIGANTRWLLGYVQRGDYSLTIGKGTGLGLVSLVALLYMYSLNLYEGSNEEAKVLFRNVNTLYYKFCKIELMI